MKQWIWIVMIPVFMVGLACSTPSAERPDEQKIKRDADQGFDRMLDEEERHDEQERY